MLLKLEQGLNTQKGKCLGDFHADNISQIEVAVDEARCLSHHSIGAEHLLLGLLHDGEGIGAGALESFSLSLQEVRAKTIRVLHEQRSMNDE